MKNPISGFLVKYVALIFIVIASCKSYKDSEPNIQDKTFKDAKVIEPVAGNYILLKDGSFYKISEGDKFTVTR